MLRDLALGYDFIITRHGIPVGRLVDIDRSEPASGDSLSERFAALAKKNGPMDQETYVKLRDEGRRY